MSLLFGVLCWNVNCYLGTKGIVKRVEEKKFLEVMRRAREYYAGPGDGRFFSGIFQKHLEKATSDYFPVFVVFKYRDLERWFAKIAFGLLPNSWTPLVPVGGDILLLKKKNILVYRQKLYSQDKKQLLITRSNYYKNLIKENPSINLFVFPVLQKKDWLVVFSDLKVDTKFFSGDKYVNWFRVLLDPSIGYSWGGKDLSPERLLMLYYKTDHHFTMQGAHMIYHQVINLLRATVKDISQPLEPSEWFSLPNVEFRGSRSRITKGYEPLFDVVEDGVFDLPDFQVFINGVNRNGEYGDRVKYLSGSIPLGHFTDHYAEYFGGDYGCIEFVNSKLNGRNLLVISDSYDNSLAPLLSSHYSHSFFIDLRNYMHDMGSHFDFKKFINDNQIDDVLFFGNQVWVLGL